MIVTPAVVWLVGAGVAVAFLAAAWALLAPRRPAEEPPTVSVVMDCHTCSARIVGRGPDGQGAAMMAAAAMAQHLEDHA